MEAEPLHDLAVPVVAVAGRNTLTGPELAAAGITAVYPLTRITTHTCGLLGRGTRSNNQVHALLHQQGLRFEGSDLFDGKGRVWLAKVEMPAGTRSAVKVHLKLIV